MGVMTEDKIVFKRINEIKPYIRNPRKNAKTIELLCELIPQVGFNVPLVIDKKGVIVKGHARYAAAIRLGMTEVPCIVTHADDEAVKVDRITDNKIAEFSTWANDELEQEISDISLDLSSLGFSREEVEAAVGVPVAGPDPVEGIPAGGEQKPSEAPPKKYYKCVCEGCGHVMFVEASSIK